MGHLGTAALPAGGRPRRAQRGLARRGRRRPGGARGRRGPAVGWPPPQLEGGEGGIEPPLPAVGVFFWWGWGGVSWGEEGTRGGAGVVGRSALNPPRARSGASGRGGGTPCRVAACRVGKRGAPSDGGITPGAPSQNKNKLARGLSAPRDHAWTPEQAPARWWSRPPPPTLRPVPSRKRTGSVRHRAVVPRRGPLLLGLRQRCAAPLPDDRPGGGGLAARRRRRRGRPRACGRGRPVFAAACSSSGAHAPRAACDTPASRRGRRPPSPAGRAHPGRRPSDALATSPPVSRRARRRWRGHSRAAVAAIAAVAAVARVGLLMDCGTAVMGVSDRCASAGLPRRFLIGAFVLRKARRIWESASLSTGMATGTRSMKAPHPEGDS